MGLPKNWVETELKNFLYLKNGYAFKSKDLKDMGVPVVRIGNIKEGKIDIDSCLKVDDKNLYNNFTICYGDILIAMSGATTGKFGIYDFKEKAFQNQRVGNLKLISEDHTDKKFLYYLLGFIKEQIEDLAYGGAQPNISSSKIEGITIPFPPLPEQERIVAKLDVLFGQIDHMKKSLERIPQLLANFKQQMLTQAVTGKLTEVWRKGREFDEWRFLSIQDLSTKVGSGATPKGGSAVYKDSGIPLIRSMNVHFGGLNYEGLVFIDDYQAEKLKNVEVIEKDVLLNITGASIGRVCIAPREMSGARVNQHVTIIRTNQLILPEYLNLYLSSKLIQDFIYEENYGVTRQALTKTQVLDIKINVPSKDEQLEIINHIESLFLKVSTIEVLYHALKDKIHSLPQSLLSKAFKGELLPQLPEDGDANDLLKEIKKLKDETKKIRKSSPEKQGQLKKITKSNTRSKPKSTKSNIKSMIEIDNINDVLTVLKKKIRKQTIYV